ncbi:MAG TPA: hypothetical protein VHB73_08080 [Alphaproteobacteria bacterium]|nr:hypothetical protein [Alphaproteobacteria bacterium]
MNMSSLSKLAIAGVLTAGMVAAPLAQAEARDWNHGGWDHHDNGRHMGRIDRSHDGHGNGNALVLGLLGGALIGSLALAASSHDEVVVHRAPPRPVYYAPAYREVYAYPAPAYYAYGY